MNIEKTVGWKALIFKDQGFLYKIISEGRVSSRVRT